MSHVDRTAIDYGASSDQPERWGVDVEQAVRLPSGVVLDGEEPIVVVGPNGSGKTRQTRQIQFPGNVEFINALRNTRVAPELPAMGTDTARQQFTNHKNQSRGAHWELEADFDPMLSQILAEHFTAAVQFERSYRADPSAVPPPVETTLRRVEELWAEVYPGRELDWREFKPFVISQTEGAQVEYSANQMSDGEKAILYLAGRVFSAPAGVLVVDEPETHLHSLLAVRVWNALEDARQDIRFIYITHDVTFALSRRKARYILASPVTGLRSIEFDQSLPPDVIEDLLGSASLSFYASRVVFCEGEPSSLDSDLYSSWFSGADTVVRAVGSCSRVMRCAEALSSGGVTSGLTAIGIIDGDVLPDEFKLSLPSGVTVLRVNEVESLLCLPEVVAAVCEHHSQVFDEEQYRTQLADAVSADQRHQIIIQRWKRRMEPNLEGLLSSVSKRGKPVDELIQDLPEIFDHQKWSFSPEELLRSERTRVEAALPDGSVGEILAIAPGKQFLPIAAMQTGMTVAAYTALIVAALRDQAGNLAFLGSKVDSALAGYLPARYVNVAGIPLSLTAST
jgi:hypothetical protein